MLVQNVAITMTTIMEENVTQLTRIVGCKDTLDTSENNVTWKSVGFVRWLVDPAPSYRRYRLQMVRNSLHFSSEC